MSQENITNKLIEYGLTKTEATIFVLLAKKGPLKAKDIINYLKSSKQQVYPSLKNLQKKGIVCATLEYPAKFSSIQFEKAIDLFSKAKMEEAKGIEKNKTILLEDWKTITMRENEDSTAKFAVIEGRKYLISKIQQMFQETKKQFCIVAPVANIIRTYEYAIDESTFDKKTKEKIKILMLTELNKRNMNSGKALIESAKARGLTIRGRNPGFGFPLFPQMVIRDNEEIILFIDQKSGNTSFFDNYSVLWTNSKSIIDSFQGIFNELWQTSTDLETKINQIQGWKQPIGTQIIINPKKAQQKLEEELKSAQKEVIMILSPNTLIDFSGTIFNLKEWQNKSIKIKILTPITGATIEIIKNMAKKCQIRHIKEICQETFVIDSLHLFQFKNIKNTLEDNEASSKCEYAFYSSDNEYIEKTKNMIEYLWKNAETVLISPSNFDQQFQQPFNDQLEIYTYSKTNSPYKKMTISYKEEPRAITEEEVLNKIATAKKHKIRNPLTEKTIFYGRRASAIIHPPKSFKLPDMILSVSKWNQKSSFGQENDLVIKLLLNTDHGEAFVPVAVLRDSVRALELKEQIYCKTPAENNIQIFSKDRFHVESYGNILFAAWTKPIILFSSKYILPPSCILFEGYGEIKTGIIKSYPNSNRKQIWEYNGMEAFVTFFHPDSKYSGPGIDGVLSRDVILTSIPNNSKKTKIASPL